MNAVVETAVIPSTPGTPFAGGYYVDRLFVAGQLYALVCAGIEGELTDVCWNESSQSVEGACSYNDGLANTEALAAAGSELAQRARASRIGDSDDWYLPSRLEALMMRCALQPTIADGPHAFSDEWYWTSTQHGSYSAYAWFQGFYWGNQLSYRKSSRIRARLVRRVSI